MRRPAWRFRRSLASRVIGLTTMAVALTVALVALAAYMTVRSQLQATLDDSLMTRAEQAAASPALARITTQARVPSAALGAGDVRIAFLYSDHARVHTYDYGPPLSLGQRPPEMEVAQGERDSSLRTVAATTGEDYRIAAVPSPEQGTALLIAQSLESQQQVLARLGTVMLVFGLLGVAVAAAAGWVVASNGLRPVRRLTRSVERIARTEDLTPMPVEGDDELARLATAFNQMLAALAASRDRQRQLVADAGHELRTPLTSLRTNLDLLSQAECGDLGPALPSETRRELIEDVRAQIEELTTLIGDLVQLARDDGVAPAVVPVDLAGVVENAVARVRRRAPSVHLDARVEPWWVVGDAANLERAVTNLLDNAAKWSPPGGTVTAALREGVLTVDDEGPGIDEKDRPHVFERFWRAEESRSMPGSGLGLSIVQQAAHRHSGEVEATRSPAGGARFVLTLPGHRQPLTVEPGVDTHPAGGSAEPAEGPGQDGLGVDAERLDR